MADPYVRLTDYPGVRNVQAAIHVITQGLSDDLLSPPWRVRKDQYYARTGTMPHPSFGHCYIATEVLHAWMEDDCKVTPMVQRLEDGGTHWYLRWEPEWAIDASPIDACVYLDPTRDQLDDLAIDYSLGTGKGFLTKELSGRAAVLASRVAGALPAPPRI